MRELSTENEKEVYFRGKCREGRGGRADSGARPFRAMPETNRMPRRLNTAVCLAKSAFFPCFVAQNKRVRGKPSLRHNKRHPQDDKRMRGGSPISGTRARNKQNASAAKRRRLPCKIGILPIWVLTPPRRTKAKRHPKGCLFALVETRGLEPMTSRM